MGWERVGVGGGGGGGSKRVKKKREREREREKPVQAREMIVFSFPLCATLCIVQSSMLLRRTGNEREGERGVQPGCLLA